MTKRYLLYALAGLSLFIFSAGAAYLITGYLRSRPSSQRVAVPVVSPTPGKKSRIDPSLPRTEECPLNGALYTKQEKDIWQTRRPLAVMVENHADARPLSGLGSADVVYEAVAEGGITRHMAIFYCGAAADNITIAPVRSARIYYTKIVPEYDALYNHVGGAGNCDDPTVDEQAKALCFIRRNKIKDMDQFGLDFKACHRITNRTDKEVAYEHTMACFTDELYRVAAQRQWTNVDEKKVPWDKNFVPWKFKSDATSLGGISKISFGFWDSMPGYSVQWQYDSASNSYLRSNGGEPDVDHNTNTQIAARDVVIQFVKQTGPVDEHMHMLYEVTGSGKMLVFQDGQVREGTWSKPSPAARTKFTLTGGKEVQFNRGQIWIELVPAGNKVEYN